MDASERLRHLVYDLLEHYPAEMRPNGLRYLELRMRGHGVLTVEELIKHRQLRVCYELFDGEGHPVPEPEVLVYVDDDERWMPYEIRRHTAGHYAFADLDLGHAELILLDPKHQADLAAFADGWAEFLRAQGWLEDADKCITQPQVWTEDEVEAAQPPAVQDLWDFVDEYGLCLATDGCWVAPEETCEHGYPSWLVALGLL
jgi:hypothetical protein